jgi:hypothetical protein|uniref:Uncharacterized protein n=1 Tax=Podoviridae sp. ctz6O13 TaxID=2827757 RepID=A0A8S5TKS2_9CAUD|nr:MAG TPA: hypothetical protein [Podoviridae sp. ctz6O13]
MLGMQNFHYAIFLADKLYDVEYADMEKAEEIGLVAYGLIGNRHTHLYRAVLKVDKETGTVELPCNALYIESVTEPCHEDWELSKFSPAYGDSDNSLIEDSIESSKSRLDPLYQSGRFVNYRQEGDALYVDKSYDRVSILYHGEMLDDDGLPYINDKEALAIAEYLSYIAKYKEGIRNNNRAALEMAAKLERQWLNHCAAARTPLYISQNDMDKILDAKTSWNRKKYHISYKPIV